LCFINFFTSGNASLEIKLLIEREERNSGCDKSCCDDYFFHALIQDSKFRIKILSVSNLNFNFYTSFKLKGNFLIRLPVRSKMALVNAGVNGGNPGSPTPPAFSSLSTMCTSISGVSVMRGIL
jgi:hypothetical protein